jgi:beta-phosphoglucomutase-like phosphatase (HAD superfamily)
VDGLGKRKNEIALRLIREQGVRAYPAPFASSKPCAGLRTAVVSSSADCRDVIEALGIEDLFDVPIDGTAVERDYLNDQAAPDTYLAAAREPTLEPEAAAMFEDALAGVGAGPAGRFGYVAGVDRGGHAEALRRLRVDAVVADLAELPVRL